MKLKLSKNFEFQLQMNIYKKIEEIRQQPENVRMRWVWGCVAVSMLVIIAVWIFSITLLFQEDPANQNRNDSLSDLKTQLQNIGNQAPSLKDYTDQPLSSTKPQEGIANKQNTEFQYPASSTDVPQSTTYSDLNNSDSTAQVQQ